jgi:type II restriction enzyme
MHTLLDIKAADKYHSSSQKIRVITESWVGNEIYCPACGFGINHYESNKPVADFFCSKCKEEYELKSKKDSVGIKIVDGAYRTMIERLQSDSNPNLFLLNYCLKNYEVMNFLVIPKHFFTPDIIEKRKPLSSSARRAGWIGCNISLQNIPQTGKIFYVKEGNVVPKREILYKWNKTLFLREEKGPLEKGWTLDVMNCVDKIGKKRFGLDEVYAYEGILRQKHPNNRHIKDKIRQQLQYLRDKRYLEFINRGVYRIK